MWTRTHRRAADRCGLRYDRDLTDAEWALVAPPILICPHWRGLRFGMASEPGAGWMSRQRSKPEEIVATRRQADVRVGQGHGRAEAIRAIGVGEVAYDRGRREFGGPKTDQVRRMTDLEVENQRLRRAIADLTLDRLIPQQASRGPGGQRQRNV